MRIKLSLFLIILVAIQITPIIALTHPYETTITVQSDGVTRLDYLFEAEVTNLLTNITVLGENYDDLFIVNENGLPLEYIKIENKLSVYSLGSSLINLTYLTAELTGKTSIIWSLNTTVPISTEIILPVSSTIISLNVIPLEIDSFDERTVLIMPAGLIEIEYTVDILDSETLAEEMINLAEETIEEAENKGAIVSTAIDMLSEAKNLFQLGNFLFAEETATKSIELVEDIFTNMTIAEAKISAAETAIEIAQESGRTKGIDIAKNEKIRRRPRKEKPISTKIFCRAAKTFFTSI